MKQDLHPEFTEVRAKYCGGIGSIINSAVKKGISIDVCSLYHPFHTVKQKTIDPGGRVERYRKRFGSTAKTMEVGGS